MNTTGITSPHAGNIAFNTLQSPQSNTNRRIFDCDNISISSKTRLVDATLTAYKLLDSAFVN